jgi:hypothetical protein
MKVMDWATFGARILELTEAAIRIQGEEEQQATRPSPAPFLRLVRAEECEDEIEADVRESGSAA